VSSIDRITSRQNAIVKEFRDAARGGADGLMLLDGQHLIEEALESGARVRLVAVTERGAAHPAVQRAENAGARVVMVTDPVLGAISPVQTPSGMVALADRPSGSLDDVFATPSTLVIMLHDVQDPGNVGAIARAAEACGATGLVCNEHTADPFSWKALRGAMGSTLRLPTIARQSLPGAIARARSAGMRILATTARGGVRLPACDLRMPAAIILGGEGAGLPADLVDSADARLTIPMQPPVESLNVAIAAALVIYEAARQRTASRVRRE
jgi:TrmH family RNA methyltransferase